MADATDQPGAADAANMAEPAGESLYCPFCMYDLRGSDSPACPECGEDLAAVKEAGSSIPWVYRKGSVPLLALFKTAVFVTFRQKLFFTEMAREVDLRAAVSFRVWLSLVVSLAVFLQAAAVFGVLVAEDVNEFVWLMEERSMALWLGLLAYGVAAVFALFYGLTGLHTYWLHPKHMPVQLQNRAVALGHYAQAPLLLLWVPCLLMTLALGLAIIFEVFEYGGPAAYSEPPLELIAAALWIIGIILVVTVVVMVMSNLVRFTNRLAGRSWLGVIGMLAGTVVGGLALAGYLFFVLPLVGVYLYIIFATL